jgi:DUF4097 and DUF4098 domain-containing protein YvlB
MKQLGSLQKRMATLHRTIDAQGKLANSNEGLAVNHKVDIIIKLPLTSQYSLNLTSLNGNILKPQLNDTTIFASTNNGKIDITDDKATDITAVSQNGNINIHLPEGTLFHVDANTANGHVTYQGIQLNVSTQTGTQLIGHTIGGQGNLKLTLSSANGIVTLEYFNK